MAKISIIFNKVPSYIRLFLTSDYLKLIIILALAFYLTLMPKLNYPYPLHLDDWDHIAHTNSMLEANSLDYPDPYSGEKITNEVMVFEAGYHLFLGLLVKCGVSWLDIYRYLPSIIFCLLILSVWFLARKEGFGWEAAFFACLMPSTVGILGPVFLVPVALSSLFVILALFIAYNFKSYKSYLLLSFITFILIFIHPQSAVIMLTLLLPYIFINLWREHRRGLKLLIALGVPFLISLPWTYSLIVTVLSELTTYQPTPEYVQIPYIIKSYGYVPIIFCIIGTFVLWQRGGSREYGLVSGFILLLIMLTIFNIFHYGVEQLYLRGLLYLMLMAGIIAGAGLNKIRKMDFSAALRLVNSPSFRKIIGAILCIVIICLTLATTIPNRINTPYYHMIDDEDYSAFIWIKNNIDDSYKKAILDPLKAVAFTAITGKYAYSVYQRKPSENSKKAYEFFANDCIDTNFLSKNGITIVYTQNTCANTDLLQVRQFVYLLK